MTKEVCSTQVRRAARRGGLGLGVWSGAVGVISEASFVAVMTVSSSWPARISLSMTSGTSAHVGSLSVSTLASLVQRVSGREQTCLVVGVGQPIVVTEKQVSPPSHLQAGCCGLTEGPREKWP